MSSDHFATESELDLIKSLADAHRHELGFIVKKTIEEAIKLREIIYLPQGFLHFHHRQDKVSTLYHLCVDKSCREQGIGRKLVSTWEAYSLECGIKKLRLKCPVDLTANGFYHHLGFTRVAVEAGKKRSLVVWEKKLFKSEVIKPRFIASLSAGRPEVEGLRKLWQKNQDSRNPFAHVLFSPISSPPSATDYFKNLKEKNQVENVWLDCGAYQVQQGKKTYEELLSFLENFYLNNQWADGYVLPDIVPLSSDSEEIIEYKVSETIYQCQHFFDKMPDYIQQRVIAPVQGHSLSQINRCLETYINMGVTRIGFGSFGTSGPNGSVNMLSESSLRLFKTVVDTAREHNLQVHCFGIGGPNSYNRLLRNNIVPHTLDSTTWWKAGGFGSIFFPHTSQIQVTVRKGIETTTQGLEKLKQKTNHDCYFCRDLDMLRTSRNHRIMHNLASWLDTLDSDLNND